MNVRELIKQPLNTLGTFESQTLPRGMPKISQVLSNIADALPAGPQLPSLGGKRSSLSQLRLPRTAGMFRSVEALLPSQAPKISDMMSRIEAATLGPEIPTAPGKTAPVAEKAAGRAPELLFE